MKKQKPDNFFREKLEGFEKTAPAGAWERIESRLEKKNNAFGFWWKIAASLLVLAIITYWFLPGTDRSKEQPLAQLKPQNSISDTEKIEPVDQAPQRNPDDAHDVTPNPVSTTDAIVKKKSNTPKVMAEQVIEYDQSSTPTKTADLDKTIQLQATRPVPLTASQDAMVKQEKITLKFSAEETSRYLNKNTLAEATSEEKKPSTLKKLLKKANDLKSNQDPFGDLREKKNEILALNFKNEKRGQNK